MKSRATTLLAALMLIGTVSAIATSNNSSTVGFSDGGPAPLCRPSDPGCPDPLPKAKVKVTALPSDGGPAPLCRPSDPGCPDPLPKAR